MQSADGSSENLRLPNRAWQSLHDNISVRMSYPLPPPLKHPSRRVLQLRAVAAALRKNDAVKGVLEALGRVELLVRAYCYVDC